MEGILVLPQGRSQGGGFVTVLYENVAITVELTPAKSELIQVLNDALIADWERGPIIRGWRGADIIIMALRYPVEKQSLQRAVSQINRLFREAAAIAAPGVDVPPLLSSRREIGYRLNWLLAVDEPGARPPG